MKKYLSYALILLGVGLLVLGVYHANQYWVQQATIAPSLDQLEKLGGAGTAGFDVEQTKALLSASTNALLQMFLVDAILGLLLITAGLWMAPEKHAH